MIVMLRWQAARTSCSIFAHHSVLRVRNPPRRDRFEASGLLSPTRYTTRLRHLQTTKNTSFPMASNGSSRRSINFKDYDVFGFDLDHTIAKYKLVKLFEVGYDCVTDFLVSQRGYDPVIKTNLHDFKDFICKGLFLDVKRGNILKLGHDGTILRATHGTRLIPESDVKQMYGEDMKWELTDTVKKFMKNGRQPDYRFFENYFDCPALVAMARVIDLLDKKDSQSVDEQQKLYTKAWDDTLQSLYNMYDGASFKAGKGGYFYLVEQDPTAFVEECSADIRRWLMSLRERGKLVFLLTSSEIDYASCLLNVCLGKDWLSYFDLSLFHGRKPDFFTAGHPFYMLENDRETDTVKELKRNGCYGQGNLDDLNKFFAAELGKDQFKVLYFGDNICSDCYPSKHFADWGTVLVLEEMDAEGYLCSDGTVPGHEHDGDEGISAAKKKKLIAHSSQVTEEEIDYLITDFWGPFLIHNRKGDIVLDTFWGDVISRYSDIAVPSLEYLAGVPLDHKFEAFTGKSGDATGFHPGRPSSLLP